MADRKGPVIVICAIDGSGVIKALEVDANDYLKVALASADGSDLLTELAQKLETSDLEIVSSILSTGPHGWIGGAWQRQPILLGYSGIAKERWNATSSGAGSTNLDSTPVPAGEIHVIRSVSMYHNDPVSRVGHLYAMDTVTGYQIDHKNPFPSTIVWINQTVIVLSPTDYLRIVVDGLADTKIAYGRMWGTRIDIDQ